MLQTPSTVDLIPALPQGSPDPAIDGARTFAPREKAELKGILVEATPSSKTRAERAGVSLAPLMKLIRLVTDWPVSGDDLGERIGDFRYLVMEFSRAADQPQYVQIWSEPKDHLLVEVGPGEPKNRALKSLMKRQTAALHGRGFQIGGNARNFTKLLPTPRTDAEVTRVAHELLALLTDVLEYKRSVDLNYTLAQGTHLKSAYVTGPMPRDILAALLSGWGLPSEQRTDDDTKIGSRSNDFDFTLQLTSPSKQSNCYWEIHCNTTFPMPSSEVANILSEINGKTWLLKACERGTVDESQTLLNLAYGINLSGGVTLDHIKSQIFEWIDNVRYIRRKAKASDVEISPDAPTSLTLH